MTYAVIQNNIVVNLVISDFEPYWLNNETSFVVKINTNEHCAINMIYDSTKEPRFIENENTIEE